MEKDGEKKESRWYKTRSVRRMGWAATSGLGGIELSGRDSQTQRELGLDLDQNSIDQGAAVAHDGVVQGQGLSRSLCQAREEEIKKKRGQDDVSTIILFSAACSWTWPMSDHAGLFQAFILGLLLGHELDKGLIPITLSSWPRLQQVFSFFFFCLQCSLQASLRRGTPKAQLLPGP